MTSRYDAKYHRGSGRYRRPLASLSDTEIDPRGTCPSTGEVRTCLLPPPIGAPEGGRDVNGVPIAPPGAVVPGRTRSGPILVR